MAKQSRTRPKQALRPLVQPRLPKKALAQRVGPGVFNLRQGTPR